MGYSRYDKWSKYKWGNTKMVPFVEILFPGKKQIIKGKKSLGLL